MSLLSSFISDVFTQQMATLSPSLPIFTDATIKLSSVGSTISLKSPSTTGLIQFTGMGAGTTRVKTILDSNDTLLELGGSYSPSGTWTFVNDITVNGITVGKGAGAIVSNTMIGVAVGHQNSTGNFNTYVGYSAAYWVASGSNNTAVGAQALNGSTTGNNNIAIGLNSLLNNMGSNNVAIGNTALFYNTISGNQTAIGYGALYNCTSTVGTLGAITGGSLYTNGTYNGVQLTLLSGSAAQVYPTANITVSGGAVTSVIIVNPGLAFKDTTTVLTCPAASIGGTGSGWSVPVATLASGVGNSAFGYYALNANSNGYNNSAFGKQVLQLNTTGYNNSGFGSGVLAANTTGTNNCAFGSNSLNANTIGNHNVAIGLQALQNNTIGNYNVAIGLSSLQSNISGNNNTAIGDNSLFRNNTGLYNTAVGYMSLYQTTVTSNQTAIGFNALANCTTNVATLGTITGGSGYANGTYNGVQLTYSSGSSATTCPTANITVSGGAVTAVTLVTPGVGFIDTTTVLTCPAASIGGSGSGFSVPVATLASGSGNVAVGFNALYNNTTGIYNTALGESALAANITANNNTAVGYNALASTTTGSDNVAIGRLAMATNITGVNNVAIGRAALAMMSTASSGNVAIGYNSMAYNVSGNNCVAVGINTLASNIGSNSVAIGYYSLYNNTITSNQTAIGYNALSNCTTNVAALGTITGGSAYTNGTYINVQLTLASGSTAAAYPTANITVSGGAVTAVTLVTPGSAFKDTTTALTCPAASIGGSGSGWSVPVATLASGSGNVAVGYSALANNTIGQNNTTLGESALLANTTGNYNTAIGWKALAASTTANNNTAIGYAALYVNTTGQSNIALGGSALGCNLTGNANIAIGINTAAYNVSGSNNVAIGQQSLFYNTITSNQTAIGYNALMNCTTNVATLGTITGGSAYTNGTYNGVQLTYSSGSTANTYPTANITVSGGAVTAVTLVTPGVAFKDTTTVLTCPAASIGGTGSGWSVPVATLQSGSGNVAVGYSALANNTTGYLNTALGESALLANSTGNYNTALGQQSLAGNTTGQRNTASGNQSLYFNTIGGSNVASGFQSLLYNTIGNYNSSIGTFSLRSNISGSSNTAIGYQTLAYNTITSNQTAIGYYSLYNCTTNVATLGTITGGSSYTNGTYNGVQLTYQSGSAANAYPTANITVSGGAVTAVTLVTSGVGFIDTTTVLTCPAASIGGSGSGWSVPVATLASGAGNVAVGKNSLLNNTIGYNNTALGEGALQNNVIGFYNTAIGYNSLLLNTASNNTAVGFYSLNNNTTGTYNTAVGRSASSANTTGSYNTSVGFSSQYSNNGSNNTSVGYSSQYSNTTGSNNTSVGYASLFSNSTTSNQTSIGAQSLYNCTTNVATLGTITGGSAYTNGTYINVQLTLASGSTAVTYPIANITVSGGAVTAVTLVTPGVAFKDTTTVLTCPAASIGGTGSGFSVPVASLASGSGNIAIGYQALFTNTIASNNIAIGENSLFNNYNSNANVAIGYSALSNATAGGSNVAIGFNSSLASTTAAQVFGTITPGSSYTNGTYNGVQLTYLTGSTALTYPTANITVSGGIVTAVTMVNPGSGFRDTTTVLTCPAASIGGSGSGWSVPVIGITSSTNNVSIGYNSLYSNTTGYFNTAIGSKSLYSNTTSWQSTAVGTTALYDSLGGNNTAIGYNAGRGITSGANNTIIGANVTGLSANLTSNIIIANGNGTINAQHDGTDWTLTGKLNLSSQIVSTSTYSAADGGGNIFLNSATGNRIDFLGVGIAAPSFTTRSIGTKIVLYPNITSSTVDWGIGIEGQTTWFSIPQAATNYYFKWYAGTTNILKLTGNGVLTLSDGTAALPIITSTTGGADTGIWYPAAQTIAISNAGVESFRIASTGAATFAKDVIVNGVTVGLGAGAIVSNTAIGNNSLANNTTGGYITAIGNQAANGNTTGQYNTVLGYAANYTNSTGNNTIAIGAYSLFRNLGNSNIAIGYQALTNNTTVSNQTAIGYQALMNCTTNVVTLGTITGGSSYTNGTYNSVQLTYSSGSTATTYPTANITVSGGAVTAVTIVNPGQGFKDTTTVLTCPAASIGGTGSGFSVPVATITGGSGNVAVGYSSLLNNTTGYNNTAIGNLTLRYNTTGYYNVSMGYNSLFNNISGYSNVSLGYQSLYSNTSGFQNVAIGLNSLNNNDSGSANTAIGHNTGLGIITGSGNTILGAQVTGLASGLTNNIILANGTGAIKAQHDGTDWTLTGKVNVASQIVSNLITGTAPFVVASTTPVANLSIGGNAATVTTNANLTGEVTSVGNAATLTNSAVIAKVLTGYTSGSGTVSASDSILSAIQKLDGNDAANLITAKAYADGLVVGLWDDRGSYNASTTNAYPAAGGSGTAGAVLKGDAWTIGVIATSGPLLNYGTGTIVRALTDAPGQTVGNWAITESGFNYVAANVANGLNQFASTTSLQLLNIISDETGSGSLVFNTSPTLITPALGTVASANFSTGTITWPTFNQSTTGNANTATTLQTARNIYGNSFNASSDLAQVITATYGGTGSAFTQFTGPTTSIKSFTLPDASATLLYAGGALGTPSSGTLTNCTFPTLNQNTTGSANSLLSPSTTGIVKITGMTAGTTRTKTVRDADDTLLELGGSYTPSGTWVWTSATVTWPTFNQATTSSANSLKSPSTTGLVTIGGMTSGVTRAKTVRDADDTLLELGGSYTPSGTWTFSNSISSTCTYSAALGAGNIYLNSATGNRIEFNTNGVAAPAFTTRSAGTKIVLYPYISGSNMDIAIGIESGALWFSQIQASNVYSFKWYAGITQVMKLDGTGVLTLANGTAALPTITSTIGGAGTGIWYPAANTIAISNNGVESLRADSAGNVGIGLTPSGTYKLEVNGNFAATTKSFKIKHPTKENFTLEYGSLESPYHGIRLTGRGIIINDSSRVRINLPDYISKLINHDTINIQLTNIKSNCSIWVDFIDIANNYFIVMSDCVDNYHEFFWDFTGERIDVDPLVVECENSNVN